MFVLRAAVVVRVRKLFVYQPTSDTEKTKHCHEKQSIHYVYHPPNLRDESTRAVDFAPQLQPKSSHDILSRLRSPFLM